MNISLETATNYAHDQNSNNFGFKCLVIGYDNPSLVIIIVLDIYMLLTFIVKNKKQIPFPDKDSKFHTQLVRM